LFWGVGVGGGDYIYIYVYMCYCHGLYYAVDDLSTVLADICEESRDEFLFLDILETTHSFLTEFDGLIESIDSSIADIYYLDYFTTKTRIEHLRLFKIILEIG
jgi:hypothetical protein